MELRPGRYGPNQEYILERIEVHRRTFELSSMDDVSVRELIPGMIEPMRCFIRDLSSGALYEFGFPNDTIANDWLKSLDHGGMDEAGKDYCFSTSVRQSLVGWAVSPSMVMFTDEDPEPKKPKVQPISGTLRVRRTEVVD